MARSKPIKPADTRNDLLVKEAAYLASVSVDWIYKRLKRIPHKRRGRRVVISRPDFMDLLKQARFD
jgi:hypothetical protein